MPLRERELHPVMDYMSATKNCLQDFPEEEVVAIRRTYFAMIAEVDAHVGRVLQAVDDLGLAQNTYIIFTSDHGEMNMEHGQYLKNSVYEASARVPLIIAGPVVERDAVVDDPVSLVDFYPTLMDMADLPTPEGLAGRSLMPYLCGQSHDGSSSVLSEYHSNFTNTGIFMLRSGAWKYVAYPGYRPQLFDLNRDPEEMEDLASIRSDVVDRMEAQLRGLVDYTEVDARAKASDRECFVAWRERLGEPKYQEAMVKLYPDWGREENERVEAWVACG
jgi:arylsulfatase K